MDHLITPSDWAFEFQQRDTHPVLMADLWSQALWSDYSREIKFPIDGLDHLFTSESKGYFKPSQKQTMLVALRRTVEMDPSYPSYVSQKTQTRITELETFVDDCLRTLTQTDDAPLASLWQTYVERLRALIPWFYVPWYLSTEDLLTNRVKQGLERHRSSVESIVDLQQALFILVAPVKPLELQAEQRAFFDLVTYAEKNPETSLEQGQIYLTQFAWMKTFLLLPIEPLTTAELVERVRAAIADRSHETYQQQLREKAKQAKMRVDLLDVLKHDPELCRDIMAAQELAWLLTASVERSLRACAKLIPFHRLLADKIGVEYVNWVHLTVAEITELLSNSSMDLATRICERRTAYVFAMEKGQSSLMSGTDAKHCIEELEASTKDVDIAITELRGQSASGGTATGRVRIARLANEAHTVEPGEILVCAMTSPDYLGAMKRAAAIVTDEGGLLCHAAIVSRELGKPCVIATKIATKRLKTGDLVEVHAHEGIVKILTV